MDLYKIEKNGPIYNRGEWGLYIIMKSHKRLQTKKSLLMFALFEDVLFSCHETAGEESEANVTCGYRYSPPSCSGKRQSRARRRLLESNLHKIHAKI